MRTSSKNFGSSFTGFTRSQSEKTRDALLDLPYPAQMQARFAAQAETSVEEQKKIEAADSIPFEIYRQQYLSPARLGLGHALAKAA